MTKKELGNLEFILTYGHDPIVIKFTELLAQRWSQYSRFNEYDVTSKGFHKKLNRALPSRYENPDANTIKNVLTSDVKLLQLLVNEIGFLNSDYGWAQGATTYYQTLIPHLVLSETVWPTYVPKVQKHAYAPQQIEWAYMKLVTMATEKNRFHRARANKLIKQTSRIILAQEQRNTILTENNRNPLPVMEPVDAWKDPAIEHNIVLFLNYVKKHHGTVDGHSIHKEACMWRDPRSNRRNP